MLIKEIISGGQTGADQGGLEAGRELGITTGGTAPMGWKTEGGPSPQLLQGFGLVEASVPGYPFRTLMNILNSDGTVIFGNITRNEPGSLLTLNRCREHAKPVLTLKLDNPEIDGFLLKEWITKYNIKKLNVAGNRESKYPGLQKKIKKFLVEVLSDKEIS